MKPLRCKTFEELRADLMASPDPLQRPLDMVGTSTYAPLAWTVPGVYRLRVVDPASSCYGQQYVGAAANVRKRIMRHLWGGHDRWEDHPEIMPTQMEARALSLFPHGVLSNDLANAEAHWMRLLKPVLNRHWRRSYRNATKKLLILPSEPPYQEHFLLSGF